MKNLLAVAAFCALLAVNHAASSSSKKLKLTVEDENEIRSFLNNKPVPKPACLIFFVVDDIYVANGALVDTNKVISTRDFLEPYKKGITQSNLYAYPAKWKILKQTRKVIDIRIDHNGDSPLAVAIIESPIPYDIGITTCLISPYFSENIVDYEITISGWRYADHFTESKILGNNIISTVNRRECHSQKPQQQIYQRNSYAIPNPDGGYKDYKSLMNKGDEGAAVTLTGYQVLLVAIASHTRQLYFTFTSSEKFLKSTNIRQLTKASQP